MTRTALPLDKNRRWTGRRSATPPSKRSQSVRFTVSDDEEREKLLPCLFGNPDLAHPLVVLDRNIVTCSYEKFSARIVQLSPFWSRLYQDARENRDGSYCYDASEGMRMIPLISKMIFPLTVHKLVKRYHYDKNEYPSDKILTMDRLHLDTSKLFSTFKSTSKTTTTFKSRLEFTSWLRLIITMHSTRFTTAKLGTTFVHVLSK